MCRLAGSLVAAVGLCLVFGAGSLAGSLLLLVLVALSPFWFWLLVLALGAVLLGWGLVRCWVSCPCSGCSLCSCVEVIPVMGCLIAAGSVCCVVLL